MYKMYSSKVLYNSVVNITNDSSIIMNNIRQLVSDLNRPIIWLFWGILLLVIIDVYQQISGNSSKYGYMVGKVMIEAFFYSLFFAIWTDFFQSRKLKQRLNIVNKTKHILNIKNYIKQPKFFVCIYILTNISIVIYYCNMIFSIIYVLTSFILFIKFSSMIMVSSYSTNNSHVYLSHNNNNKNIDAIIKWEYSNVKKDTNSNWVMVYDN